MKSFMAANSLATFFCSKARCEEDMFREVTYILLGLIMNLCLQVPFVSEVQHSCHPPRSPSTDWPHAIVLNCALIYKENRSRWTQTPVVEMGRAGRTVSLCSTEGHSVMCSFRKLSAHLVLGATFTKSNNEWPLFFLRVRGGRHGKE
jgi:hypothetical protein